MKILCEFSPAGPKSVRDGWRKVFEACGHQFVWWVPEQKPIFDLFAEHPDADIFLTCTYSIDPAMLKALKKQRKELKVGMFASAHGDICKIIDKEKFPIDMATTREIDLIKQLKDETGWPHFVFLHVVPSKLHFLLGKWAELGIPILSVLNGADTFEYLGGKENEALKCDIGFAGGYWPYKARNINPYLLPFCSKKDINVKIWGYGEWPVPQFMGSLDSNLEKDMFASAKICPSISEPHSTEPSLGYDVIERNYKPPLSGGLVISDYVPGIDEVFGLDVIPMAKIADSFHDLIYQFLKKPEKRAEYSKKQKRVILEKHTYFHRVIQLLEGFNLNEEAGKVQNEYQKLARQNL